VPQKTDLKVWGWLVLMFNTHTVRKQLNQESAPQSINLIAGNNIQEQGITVTSHN
jgi:hypothetical protein